MMDLDEDVDLATEAIDDKVERDANQQNQHRDGALKRLVVNDEGEDPNIEQDE